MALNIFSILKVIGKSGEVAGTVNSLIKQYKKFQKESSGTEKIDELFKTQSAINEKLETQISMLEDSLLNLKKLVKSIAIVTAASIFVALIALLFAILL